jgi:pantoate--beta-alanine ligase
MTREANRLLRSGKQVVFVPTMGFFHQGHLALMRTGRKYGDTIVVSIFVNPTQFGPSEDFQTYPRDLDRDIRMAGSVGVDVLFIPESGDMYTVDHETYVEQDRLPRDLCGLTRPRHFRGVATVVTKLFNIVRPQTAMFGEKDYQQLTVIRRLVKDLNMDIRIVGVETVREDDGLAMSSRNAYLSAEERRSALALSQSLQLAQKRVAEGTKDAKTLVEEVSSFIGSFPYTKIDYVAFRDPETLEEMYTVNDRSLLALAVWVGKTRLIDNTILTP